MPARGSIYWSSTTNYSPIKIWTSTRSHLRKDNSGPCSTLKKGTPCSLEIHLRAQNIEHGYVASHQLPQLQQHQQLRELPPVQDPRQDPESHYLHRLLPPSNPGPVPQQRPRRSTSPRLPRRNPGRRCSTRWPAKPRR